MNHMHTTLRRLSHVMLLLPLLATLGLMGCGYAAHALFGGERTVDVAAEYRGLDEQRVAVLVAVHDEMLGHFPQAPSKINQAVSAHLAQHVPGITVTEPARMIDFQINNPFWNAIPYSQIVRQMDVDRLVLVDLSEYRTREPGNRHLWQGRVSGRVTVIDAHATDPDSPVYEKTVVADFPENQRLGVPEHGSDQASIELGMISLFARNTTNLFHDHKEKR